MSPLHPHELARLALVLSEIGLAHHVEHDERRKNAASGFNPYSYNDPRHEPMQREFERVQMVRAARAKRRALPCQSHGEAQAHCERGV
jgi:hypothetical protein